MSAGRPRKIMLCAAEPSGDALGAALATALKDKDGALQFTGCGGPQMAAAGVDTIAPIDALSVMGPVSALKALPHALALADQLAAHALEAQVDAAVLIDSWAFSKMIAKRLRAAVDLSPIGVPKCLRG